MWRNIQLGKDRLIKENVLLIHKLLHEAHDGNADGDGHHPFTCLASADLSIWPLISGVQQRRQHSCLMSPAIFHLEFVTATCFVGEQSLACFNTLGHNCIVQGDHVEDDLTRLLWPAMSLSIMTKERSWSFNKSYSDISLAEHICQNRVPRNCAMVILMKLVLSTTSS